MTKRTYKLLLWLVARELDDALDHNKVLASQLAEAERLYRQQVVLTKRAMKNDAS